MPSSNGAARALAFAFCLLFFHSLGANPAASSGDPVRLSAMEDAAHEQQGVFSPEVRYAAWLILRDTGLLSSEAPFAGPRGRLDGEAAAGSATDNIQQALDLLTDNLGPTELAVFWSSPVEGLLVIIAGAFAVEEAERRYPDSLFRGIGDAFRHGYWQALSAFLTREHYARLFGIAHELDSPASEPDLKLELWMDLVNNAVGRSIGAVAARLSQVLPDVQTGIDAGDFVYYLNGELVPTHP